MNMEIIRGLIDDVGRHIQETGIHQCYLCSREKENNCEASKYCTGENCGYMIGGERERR